MKSIPTTFGHSNYPLSPALKVDNFIFVSGQVPVNQQGVLIAGSVARQTEQVLLNIKLLLEEAGGGLEDVVKTTVYLNDVKRDFQAMNEVYSHFFPGRKPTRSTIGAQLVIDALIEIEAVAYLTGGEPSTSPRL